MRKIKISVIIPFRRSTSCLNECLFGLASQSYQNLEIILLPDKKEIFNNKKIIIVSTGRVGPAKKRDIGAKLATGEILAFIDDDAYPDKNWLAHALKDFKNPKISAVCGPGVTPPSDNLFQQSSGWINSLLLGSAGAGTYRFIPKKKRFVDDFPAMNFFVRKKDFNQAGGFDTHFWPGEDTKLCYDLVYTLGKKILYDPSVLVYHHRRPLFAPHLKQISRFAIHRGHFARILPKTSFRLGYFLPTLFVFFLLVGLAISLINKQMVYIYLSVLGLYILLIIFSVITVIWRTKSLLMGILTGGGIFLTHLFYGILFPYGFIKKTLRQ